MTTTAQTARPAARLTGRRRAGLVVTGVIAALNIPSAFTPTPGGGEEGPPMEVLVADSVLGLIGLVAVVVAWRARSARAARAAVGSVVLIMLTGLPAFFVDVPPVVKAMVGAGVLVTVLASVLTLSGPWEREDRS